MEIRQNVPLRDFSTMRLGGTAAFMVEASSREEVRQAVEWANERNLPVIMVGGGSNIVWRDEGFDGLIILSRIFGYEERQEGDDFYITIGAGENWDKTVARTVEKSLTGIECLSLIPGTVGGTPVQNVGAYGQEIAQTLVSVEAYDREAHEFVSIANKDCGFGYRTSRFKTRDHGRFFITSITLRLKRGNPKPPFYNALQKYLDENNLRDYTPAVLRQAVIAIRQSKLPDPAKVANTGSFFANPIISMEHLRELQKNYDDVPNWPLPNGQVKIPAAWLIEKVGLKGAHDAETGMATWPSQPLVLVNERARATADLLKFRAKILDAVQQKFNITLHQEPELLP